MRQIQESDSLSTPLGPPKRLTEPTPAPSKCSKVVEGKPHLRQNEKGQLETYQHVAGKR